MIYGLLIALYLLISLFIVLIVLVQKTKSSMGLGGMGSSTQMLFGGSGGQDVFQKITWILITIFLASSLVLAIMRSNQGQRSALLDRQVPIAQPISEDATPEIPNKE